MSRTNFRKIVKYQTYLNFRAKYPS